MCPTMTHFNPFSPTPVKPRPVKNAETYSHFVGQKGAAVSREKFTDGPPIFRDLHAPLRRVRATPTGPFPRSSA